MHNTIIIETAYNVKVEYSLTTVWERIWAYIIDMLIKICYIVFIILLISTSSKPNFLILAILLLPYMFYTLLFETFLGGQTLGKKAMNIKVLSLDGRNLTSGQLITRWIVRLLDFWVLSSNIAFLAVASTAKGQRIGDMMANTTVISLRDKSSISKSSRVRLPQNYVGQYPQVLQLKDHEIELLKQVIRDQTEANHKLKTHAAQHIENLLNIPKMSSSKDFLKMIVYDYNYFHALAEDKLNANIQTGQ